MSPMTACRTGSPLVSEQETSAKPTAAKLAVSCAECGRPMVVRTNSATGEEFLGCSQFPACKHTEPLPEWFRLKTAGAAMLPGFGG
jgi:restriction system protein